MGGSLTDSEWLKALRVCFFQAVVSGEKIMILLKKGKRINEKKRSVPVPYDVVQLEQLAQLGNQWVTGFYDGLGDSFWGLAQFAHQRLSGPESLMFSQAVCDDAISTMLCGMAHAITCFQLHALLVTCTCVSVTGMEVPCNRASIDHHVVAAFGFFCQPGFGVSTFQCSP